MAFSSGNVFEKATFFQSPISTLLESLQNIGQGNIDHADIAQAYNLFVERLKLVAHGLGDKQDTWPALTPVKHHITEIAQCLRRDILLAFNDSLSNTPSYDPYIPASLTPPVRPPNADDVHLAEQTSTLSHHALQLLTVILRLPVLNSMLTDEDFNALWVDLFDIVTVPVLPCLNGNRVKAIAITAICNSILPHSFMESKQNHIVEVLRIYLSQTNEDAFGHSQFMQNTVLKGIHNLLAQCPTLFRRPFTEFLPKVFDCLLSAVPTVRRHAAYALCGFAWATLKHPEYLEVKEISRITSTFISSQISSNSAAAYPWPRGILATLLYDSAKVKAGKAVCDRAWACSVMAALIVMSDGMVFMSSRIVLFAKALLILLRASTWRPPQHVWRCLVWALARMRARIGDMDGEKPITLERWDRAFNFVFEENRGSVGNLRALLCTLIGPIGSPANHPGSSEEDKTVAFIIRVLQQMLTSESPDTQQEAIGVFTRLFISRKNSGTEEASDLSQMLPLPFMDGSFLDDSDLSDDALDFRPDLVKLRVQTLSDIEIIRYCPMLQELWINAIRHTVMMHQSPKREDDLMHIWQTLLLTQTQLTQGNGHLTATPQLRAQIVSNIAKILRTVCPSTNGDHNNVAHQVAQLETIQNVWLVARLVVSSTLELEDIALNTFQKVSLHEFAFDHGAVKAAWDNLRAQLAACEGGSQA
ncbi:hypothetical protein K474DRAFT_1776135 [Panus rudis PR-1116 ss-1]|nr:hypothetical protein K474DRAFT_1776135 [Panus rudis PR-1116 ss-1]